MQGLLSKLAQKLFNLRNFNNFLTLLVAAVALYLVIAPFWPEASWWLRHDSPLKKTTPVVSLPQLTINNQPSAPNQPQAKAGDRLIIPAMDLDETIYSGGIGSLNKGVWRLPYSSTPDKGGNTVLVGHRFTYAGSAVFYHLDKVKIGDHVGLVWQGKNYEYEVNNMTIVPPSEVSIEANTSEPRLTIYTCTLFTAKDRLVIQARLIGEDQ